MSIFSQVRPLPVPLEGVLAAAQVGVTRLRLRTRASSTDNARFMGFACFISALSLSPASAG